MPLGNVVVAVDDVVVVAVAVARGTRRDHVVIVGGCDAGCESRMVERG